MERKSLGKFGEEKAQIFLKKKGYAILDVNFKNQWGELDIVAKEKKKIVFVEVKTIHQNQGFGPEDEVGWKKERQLRKMAQIYLGQKKIPLDAEQQIDIVAVEVNRQGEVAEIRHFENVIEDVQKGLLTLWDRKDIMVLVTAIWYTCRPPKDEGSPFRFPLKNS